MSLAFFIPCVNMTKKRTIQESIETRRHQEDIPPGVDKLLRLLAGWTAEDLQDRAPAQADTNTRAFKETIYD